MSLASSRASAIKARNAVLLIGKDARQDFQGDVTTQVRIARAIDVAHASRADSLADHVGADAASGQAGRFLREQIGGDLGGAGLEKPRQGTHRREQRFDIEA